MSENGLGTYGTDVAWGAGVSYLGAIETKLSDRIYCEGVEFLTAVLAAAGLITAGTAEIFVSNDDVNYAPIPGGLAALAIVSNNAIALRGDVRGFKYAKLRTVITLAGGGTLSGKWGGS